MLAALPKPIDYVTQPAPPQPQREHAQGPRQQGREQRRPNKHWAAASADNDGEDEALALLGWDASMLLDASSARAPRRPVALGARPPQPEQAMQPPQPPSRQASCNVDLPFSPTAAF